MTHYTDPGFRVKQRWSAHTTLTGTIFVSPVIGVMRLCHDAAGAFHDLLDPTLYERKFHNLVCLDLGIWGHA